MKLNAMDVENVVGTLRDYYVSGQTRSASFRKEMLRNLRSAILEYEDEITEALHKDLRKSAFESYVTEIGFVLSSISNMIKNLDKWMEPESVKTPVYLQPAKSFIVREPYGVALIIGPFNYPFQLIMEPLIGAIAGGNCAVVKPSESAVHTAQIIQKIIQETFSENYILVIQGAEEETSLLIHAPFDKMFFTGSVRVGKIVMKAAAERLTPVTLELGGKSPVLVDQTADIKKAAERIAWGKFVNTGQTCIAPDYLLVHRSVKDQLIQELIRVIRKFYGEQAANSPDYGRMIHERHFQKVVGVIEKERDQIIYGGGFDQRDLYIEPTLLHLNSWNSPAMEGEIFGPVLPILTYDNLGHAIHQVRQYPKPLAAYFFTENEKAANFFIENCPFGGGCINDTISHAGNSNLPFGGVGQSGMNAYHGKASFDVFTHAKSMMHRNTKIPMKLAFPPYENKLKLVKSLLR